MMLPAILLLVCVAIMYAQEELSCLSNEGYTIDWWFMYKLPDSPQFAYMDANNQTFNIYPNDLYSDSQALAWTMRQIYNEGIYFNWIAYNNKPPSNYKHPSTTNGRSNGFFAFTPSTTNGFWLIHSLPEFPNMRLDKYSINSTSLEYAQSFLCINFLNYEQWAPTGDIFNDIISYQLRFMQPNIYDSHNFNYVGVTNNFTDLLKQKWLLNDRNMEKFVTWGSHGQTHKYEFTQFARSANWKGDLYEDFVSEILENGFIWETNRNISNGEKDIQPSFCEPDYKYDEVNVDEVQLSDGTKWNYMD
eukprot:241449_1